MSHYQIREAEEDDCEEIIRLAKELAAHCRAPGAIHTTADVLKRDRRLYECLLAEQSPESSEKNKTGPVTNAIIGYALFSYSYDTWDGKVANLQEIYVLPKCRGQGVGTKLMQHVAKMVLNNGCSTLYWYAFNFDVSALNFYRRIGAEDLTKTEGALSHKMNKNNLEQLAFQQ